ncbi:AAA family ATPase [Nocardioides daejeonensis]|uniref:AAA family ATPase n=1 Tax=Nocardioides daejeonensis TaxID=1046556 RepID=UPI000D74EDBD|nr:AAA family ATPase [Nocardioides daejeonensis]
MLDADDPQPYRARRILVAGVSGAGKTTLARRIATRLELPHTEIDALYHGPGWTPRPTFLDDVLALVAAPAWVTEWQYASARPLLAEAADLMVWLDPPFRQTMARITRRTLRRRLRREELWNGNVEPPLWTVFTDRDHVWRWSIRTRREYDELVPAAAAANPALVVVRLRSQAEVERWLARLT